MKNEIIILSVFCLLFASMANAVDVEIDGDLNMTSGIIDMQDNKISWNDLTIPWLGLHSNLGIKWDTTDNEIQFFKDNNEWFRIDMDDGKIYVESRLDVHDRVRAEGFIVVPPFGWENDDDVLGVVNNDSWEFYTPVSINNETKNLNDGLRVRGARYGVYSHSNGSSGNYNYGVYGEVTGGTGTTASGVYGYVSASNAAHSKIIGVEGKVGGTSSGIKKGVVATLDGSTSTSDYAIEGYVSTGSGYSIYASGGSGIKIYSGDVRIENGAVCVDDDYFCTPGMKGEIDAAKFNVNSNPDIAEMFYTPNAGGGDVVCITQANTFGWCNENDYRVAGIVSTTPGFLLNSKCGGHNAVEVRARDIQDGVYDHEGNRISDNELIGYGDDPNACVGWLPIALQGRVPAKVDCSNAISPGDRLVTSSTNGHLKKYMGENAGDLLVAKALESCASGTSVIDVWI